MLNDRLATFTDRREAIALFNWLRGRDPDKPWPLLPILAFVAPGGSGKSLLLRYLREKECNNSGRPALPYAYLDFTLSHAPKDLLSILMELRDQLQQQDDGQGNHLVFPRFDLGSLIVQASMNEDISSLSPTQVRQRLSMGMNFITSLSGLASSLGLAVPYVAALLSGLHLAGQIKPLRDILSYLEDSTGWKWYRMHGTETRLGANATLRDVLLRLHFMSMPGKPERDFLVNQLLPAAFLADLFAALLDADPPHVWSKTDNLVFFLDGFEALQLISSETATRLLEILTLPHRKQGDTDPLLLVVGGRDYLPGSDRKDGQQGQFQPSASQNDQEARRIAKTWHARWQQSLPPDKHFLRLEDLYLTIELQDFVPEDTRSYLLKFGEQRQTSLFTDNDALVQTIGQLTHGHPLFLALAAAAVLEANARGKRLTPNDFEWEKVSSDIAAGHAHERIRDYLLNLFLRQLSETECKELIYCAVPRFLDFALLRVLLPKLDDIDRQQRWNFYQRLTFMRPVNNERLVFHPLVRTLLLRQLPADQAPESDYYRIHANLRDYFHKLANQQRSIQPLEVALGEAQIEEVYHALAMGDPEPAITLGVVAQRRNLSLWGKLLETIEQAPNELMPDDISEQAINALQFTVHHRDLEKTVKVIVLYILLLTSYKEITVASAPFHDNLGVAFNLLTTGDREANLRQAIKHHKAALQKYTREAFPREWAMAQDNLGLAYRNLPGGDREANLRQAIEHHRAALQVRTREAFPIEWARTFNNLGMVYHALPGGNWEGNQRRAIRCYEAALQVRTREAFPKEWAMTKDNLGIVYSDLIGAGLEPNQGQAIKCHEEALQVRTRDTHPMGWVTSLGNLGRAYAQLPGENREANIRKAIKCFKEVLQVLTQENYPVEWAKTQENLGSLYILLPGGDRKENLLQAITYYEAALQVRTQEAFPVEWAGNMDIIKKAKEELRNLE
jgi:tetratricopeptide (TPR) repeat protein